MKSYYNSKIEESKSVLSKLKKLNAYFVGFRLISFLAIILSIFFVIEKFNAISASVTLLSLICFAWVLKKADRNEHEIEYYKTLNKFCTNEIDGKNENSLNNGEQFNKPNHLFATDLDIFGNASIYKYINRTVTSLGAKSLANMFLNPMLNIIDIRNRQDAIRELSSDKDFLVKILTSINLKRNSKYPTKESNIEKWLQTDYSFHPSKISMFIMRILPIINMGLFVAMLFKSIYALPFIILLAIQSVAFGYYNKQTARVYTDLDWCMNDILIYEDLIKQLKEKEFSSQLLKQSLEKITKYEETIHFLKKIVTIFDKRNTIVGFFTNILMLQHFFAAIKLENWKANHRDQFWKLIKQLSELEAYASFSLYALNNSDFIYPEFKENIILNTTNIGHPLINRETRVDNNINIDNKSTSIITGANMAGKSTFLRTIGVNLLLAEMGLPVCAKSFSFSPIILFTSMRAIDDLDSGISYFYAEALRLQKLIEVQKTSDNILFIADELFRGTNSDDKLHASISLIERLIKEGKVTTIVATHDLGVTKLEESYPKTVKNYCFETINTATSISFDYKLKTGITSTHNAYLLLQQMGIVY